MDFQGFQFLLHPALIVLIVAALGGLSWYSYRGFNSIPALGRWGLISLRATALILIFLLLLNPYFYSSEEVEIKPEIAVFLDNSESIGISKGEYDGLNTYSETLEAINFPGIEEADFTFYSLGESVRSFAPDSVNATEIQTNLSEPIQSVLEMGEEVQAAIIISDGIFTFGRNPSVNALNSSIPIYTVALGDTTRVQDIAVSQVNTNATGYTNTNHVIEADITQSGFQNNSTTVSLIGEDGTLEEQQISFETQDQVKTVRFELELEEPGLKQFEIRSQPLPQEWTESNNSRIFSIDVLDSRVKILHVAFEIHPDVKAFRNLIEEDINNELYPLTWIGGNRFIEEMPDEDEFDLIIIHGVPSGNVNLSLLSAIEETPTIFAELSNRSKNQFQVAGQLQVIESTTNQLSQITLFNSPNNREHPILELPESDFQNAPPLFSPIRSEITVPGATPLLNLNYSGVQTEFPVVSVSETGNIRRAHILAWGWYRMLQNTSQIQRSYTESLFTNLISWTSSNPDDRLLRITPAKRTFSTSESPMINGSLLNERGEPETDGIIEFQLSKEDTEGRSFNMESTGEGNYRLSLPRLSEGFYNYTATARKSGREIDTQTGEFLVSNISSELVDTDRNDDLLRSISTGTGGAFFPYQDAANLYDSLSVANVLEVQTDVIENYAFPVRSIYWFILAVLLLASEWLLRKYYSLP